MTRTSPEQNQGYHVVSKGKGGENGNHPDVLTRTAFGDREHFEDHQRESDSPDEVVAQGIAEEDAAHIAETGNTLDNMLGAAVEEATINGTLDEELFKTQLINVLIVGLGYQSHEAIEKLIKSLEDSKLVQSYLARAVSARAFRIKQTSQ